MVAARKASGSVSALSLLLPPRGLEGPWEELSDEKCVHKACQVMRDLRRPDRTAERASGFAPIALAGADAGALEHHPQCNTPALPPPLPPAREDVNVDVSIAPTNHTAVEVAAAATAALAAAAEVHQHEAAHLYADHASHDHLHHHHQEQPLEDQAVHHAAAVAVESIPARHPGDDMAAAAAVAASAAAATVVAIDGALNAVEMATEVNRAPASSAHPPEGALSIPAAVHPEQGTPPLADHSQEVGELIHGAAHPYDANLTVITSGHPQVEVTMSPPHT